MEKIYETPGNHAIKPWKSWDEPVEVVELVEVFIFDKFWNISQLVFSGLQQTSQARGNEISTGSSLYPEFCSPIQVPFG